LLPTARQNASVTIIGMSLEARYADTLAGAEKLPGKVVKPINEF